MNYTLETLKKFIQTIENEYGIEEAKEFPIQVISEKNEESIYYQNVKSLMISTYTIDDKLMTTINLKV